MTTTVAELAALLKTGSAPRLKGENQVWRLDGDDGRAESLRLALLGIAARFPSVFVHCDGGKPVKPGLKAATQVERDVWRLPPTATGPDLSAWLYMGNWQLYGRGEPLKELRDLCREDDAGVRLFIHEAAVSFIIDSFHDNSHLTIGLQAKHNDA